MGVRWRTSHSVVAGAVTVAALGWAASEAWPGRRPLSAPPIVVSAAYVDFLDTLRRHETFSDVLKRAGIVGADYAKLLAAATDLPLRRLPARLAVQFRRLKTDSVAHRVTVRTGPEARVALTRHGGDTGWVQRTEIIAWTPSRLRVSGVIESSLYDALDRALSDSVLPGRERRYLAWAIAEVYDWEVDFTRDPRPGDRFDVLIDRLESPAGERRYGRIVAARVDVARRPSYAFYFEADSLRGAFYDEDGRSLKRAFLRNPLEFRRISSRFGGRYHPILRTWRSHQGVDYAAAYGTPVRATADGMVTKAERDGGYGLMVELRHVNGIRTRYGHLSRLAPDVRVGARVRQRETVGYVGSSGLSTGPHLHYEFLVSGRPTNPRPKHAGAGTPVPKHRRAAFDSVRAQLLAQLDSPFAASTTTPTAAARDD